MKKCGRCQQEKEFAEFNKCKKTKTGFHNHCRICQKEVKANWYEKNREFELIKGKTEEHKEYARNKAKEKYWSNPLWRERQLEINRERRKNPQAREAARKYEKMRISTDINYKMAKVLRSRLKCAVKRQQADKTATFDLLGCTLGEFIDYIQSKFTKGMYWSNHGYGKDKWHIDHIIPCASFDLTDPEQQKKCFHYTNMQPLWQFDNQSKGCRIV